MCLGAVAYQPFGCDAVGSRQACAVKRSQLREPSTPRASQTWADADRHSRRGLHQLRGLGAGHAAIEQRRGAPSA